MYRSVRLLTSFLVTSLAFSAVPGCAAEDTEPETPADDDLADDDSPEADAGDDDVADDDTADDDSAADDDATDDDSAADDDATDDDQEPEPPVVDAGPSDDAAVVDDAGDAPSPDAGDAASSPVEPPLDAGEADAGPPAEQQLELEELGMFEPPSGNAEGTAVDGSTVYLAATSAGVYILDMSDPSAPALAGQYDFPSGQLAFRVAVDGDRLVVGLRGNGWALLDVADPENVVLLASDDGVDASDVALRGDTLYYLNANGPSSVDVSDPENPLPLVTDLVLPGADDSMLYAGDHLYVTQNGAGFSIVDATDAADLVELSSTAIGLGGNDLVLVGSALHVAHSEGVETFDVTDPVAPSPLGSFPRERAHLLAFAHDRLLVFGDDTNTTEVPFVEILDARDPAALVAQTTSYDQYADPVAATVSDDLLYVSVGDDDSLHVFGLELVPVP
jgi:hypothetical protein